MSNKRDKDNPTTSDVNTEEDDTDVAPSPATNPYYYDDMTGYEVFQDDEADSTEGSVEDE